MKLDNRIAVVTGASRGIGKCIAISLAQAGVHLALIARNEKDLCATAYTCEQYGVTAKIYPFDLTDLEGIPHLVATIKRDFKHIDILINDAGKYEEADPAASDVSSWDKTLDLNFKSVYHLTTEIIRNFSEKETAIVNISSISGLTVTGGGEIYNASKAAIKSYGGCLFEDLRENGTKVINIYPGYVNTSMTSEESKLDHAKMIQPKDVADAVLWAIQTPSTTCPTDITLRPQFSPSKKAA
jgi:NADP-dependent 3-hydroxy acid dehydrogenase YdfG